MADYPIQQALLAPLLELENYSAALDELKKGTKTALCAGVIDSQKRHLAWALARHTGRGLVYIAHNELKAREAYEDLRFFTSGGARLYPARDPLFYDADVHSQDMTKQRFRALAALGGDRPPALVVSVDSLTEPLTPPEVFRAHVLVFEPGRRLDLDDAAAMLIRMGYERTAMVEEAGQFCVRGGLLDVFPPTAAQPARVELWGDEIDSVRLYDRETQRSTENVGRFEAFPVREILYTAESLKAAAAKLKVELGAVEAAYRKKGLDEAARLLAETMGETVERMENGAGFGAERFAAYFYDCPATILDYLPKDTLLVFDEPARLTERAKSQADERALSLHSRLERGQILPGMARPPVTYHDALKRSEAFPRALLTTMMTAPKDFKIDVTKTFVAKGVFAARGKLDAFEEDLRYYIERKYRVVILAGGKTAAARLREELTERGFAARAAAERLEPAEVYVSEGGLYKGFEYPLIHLAVVSGKELLGGEAAKRKPRKRPKGAVIDNFLDMRVGDYVVHDNHGVGLYQGIEKIAVDGANKDYLKIAYQDGGVLYVATDQLDLLQKYIGGESAKPRVNKLGGGDWAKAKGKARAAVEILAKDLIKLYAKREQSQGFAYSKDTVWQTEFEEQFVYDETDDQLAAIEDVKADMESPKVMDRLLCGDVGYGKTEVALRAAFKAVQDGKQVAFLVPTTILAQQHYNTFTQRMKDYAVNVELLSRFRSAKQQAETIERLKRGAVDVVIGTHRLLGKDVAFISLGLVIVDEEQRFGVSHKDKLKKLTHNVDVLTLTATPIPRTLHMSLTGIRDMSLLNEPPQERRPVQTYVMEYSPESVRDAINRELARGGQVYYLHNRVRNIAEAAGRVRELAPEARVAFAHGQMNEAELENVMMDFINGEIDVLVCTTIIETGLDIPNVNTIIVQDADHMGLSQLYQLRGRVGRSNRSSFAYLCYRRDKVLTEISEKRLQTIREFTEFGSGFKIAMRDLEIRGAGNLLGAQQHGHMDAVGYDMYCKLLKECVDELRGIAPPPSFETLIDVNVNAFIPPYYIGDEQQKLEMYKRIALINDTRDLMDARDELFDRYGEPPAAVRNLLDVALLKARARAVGVISVKQRGQSLVITFKADACAEPAKIAEAVMRSGGRLAFKLGTNPQLTYKFDEDDSGFVNGARAVLEAIA